MKKTILILFVLTITVLLSATTRDVMTLSNHGASISNYWNAPNQYGDIDQGVQYTAVADCTLETWQLLLYNIVGTPPSIVVHVYGDNGGYPGVELGSLTVPTSGLVTYSSGWNNIDLSSLNISLNTGDVFYITYTVTNGVYGTAEVQWLSDNGTYATTSKTYQGNGSSWLTMGEGWGTPYEMFANAVIETTGTVGPIFDINFESYNYGLTAIGGGKYEIFTISNTGGGAMVLQSVGLTGSSDFSGYWNGDVPTFPLSLANGESVSLVIDYYPTDVGSDSGSIDITLDDREVQNIPLSGSGYIHNTWASAGAMFDQSPAGNQGDYAWSMSTSDTDAGYLKAENFAGLTEQIGSIDFWGVNFYNDGSGWSEVTTENPMDFQIIFYNNDANDLPGTIVQTYNPTISRETITDSLFNSSAVYKYHYELPSPITLNEGWVSIQGTSTGTPDNAWFLWSTSPIGDIVKGNYTTAWGWDATDLAFALYPSTAIDPPQDITITMNGQYPEISWTDAPGLVNNIYRADTPGGAYNVVGTVGDGAGSFLDTSITQDKHFYHVTNNTMVSRRMTMTPLRAIRRIEPRLVNRDETITQ